MIDAVHHEKSLLGLCFLDRAHFDHVAASLRVEELSLDSNRKIFSAMVRSGASGEALDQGAVAAELGRVDLESIGGVAYLTDLVIGVPNHAPSVKTHLRAVREAADVRRIANAARLTISRIESGQCSPDEIRAGLFESALSIESAKQSPAAVSLCDILPGVLTEMQAQAKRPDGLSDGFTYGLSTLDEITSGPRCGETTVVAALPGRGKTQSTLQMLAANALRKVPCGFFSMEMSRNDIGRRLLTANTSIPAEDIRNPHLLRNWRGLAEGAATLSKLPIVIDDSPSLEISQLIARAKVMVRQGVRLIAIDYLQLIRDSSAKDIRIRVGNCADAVRQFAKSENVPVILLSQLRRPDDINARPHISQLRESSEIECHAHVVLLLHCPENEGVPTGEDQIIIGKNRNGPRGNLPIFFNTRNLRFVPRDVNR